MYDQILERVYNRPHLITRDKLEAIRQFVTLRAGYRSLFNHSSLAYGLGLAATGPRREFFGLSGAAGSGVAGFGASRTSTCPGASRAGDGGTMAPIALSSCSHCASECL